MTNATETTETAVTPAPAAKPVLPPPISGASGCPTSHRSVIICCVSIRPAGTSALAAGCPMISSPITRRIVSARAISSSALSSTGTSRAPANCVPATRSGRSRRRFSGISMPRRRSASRTAYRRRGIGEQLFRRIQRAATNHGVETIEIVCMPDNIGMIRLAAKFKAQFTFEENTFTGRLTARRPTPLSMMR